MGQWSGVDNRQGSELWGLGHQFLGEWVEDGPSMSRAPSWLSLLMSKAAHFPKSGPESAAKKSTGRLREFVQSEQGCLGEGTESK